MGVDAVEVLNVVKHDDTPTKMLFQIYTSNYQCPNKGKFAGMLIQKRQQQGTLPTILVLLVTKLLKQLLVASN